MALSRRQPTAYIHDPQSAYKSTEFAGQFINSYELSKDHGLCHSHVWRILTGERKGSTAYVRRIAKALGMSLEAFVDAADAAQATRLSRLNS